MDRQNLWEDYLYLVEFSYNNGYYCSIGMTPFQDLYGHPCHTPLSWDTLEDNILLGPKMLPEMEQQEVRICEHMSTAQDRQKKYVNGHRTDKQFVVGEKFLLRVRLWKSSICYGKGFEACTSFCGIV